MAGHFAIELAIEPEEPDLVGRAISVRTTDWCYVMQRNEGPELHDRRTGRFEQMDLARTADLAGTADLAEIELAMRDRLLGWMPETSGPVPLARDPLSTPTSQTPSRAKADCPLPSLKAGSENTHPTRTEFEARIQMEVLRFHGLIV